MASVWPLLEGLEFVWFCSCVCWRVCLIFSPLCVLSAAPCPPREQDDEVATVEVKEQERNVLVLKRVQSCSPAPPAGGAERDWR